LHLLLLLNIDIYMGNEITYQWIQDGENIEIENIQTSDAPAITNGIVQLVNGNVTISTIYAGKPVILSRNQSLSSAIGNLYVDTDFTIVGVEFRIRSTNVSDNGEVYYQIVL
jgi:hypothetical protein